LNATQLLLPNSATHYGIWTRIRRVLLLHELKRTQSHLLKM
jgi:hypothetical protein